MTDITTLKPLQRAALRAGLDASAHTFLRTRGGYLPATGERTIFTTRTIRAMERARLIVTGQFAETAVLTAAGVDVAKALREADASKAGAA